MYYWGMNKNTILYFLLLCMGFSIAGISAEVAPRDRVRTTVLNRKVMGKVGLWLVRGVCIWGAVKIGWRVATYGTKKIIQRLVLRPVPGCRYISRLDLALASTGFMYFCGKPCARMLYCVITGKRISKQLQDDVRDSLRNYVVVLVGVKLVQYYVQRK
jgi:hypothetical protein